MILVTGAAGFIGSHVAAALLDRGEQVLGVDLLTDYYDPGLKAARLARLEGRSGFRFRRLDLADTAACLALAAEPVRSVVHLAAQPGVRHSLKDPFAYVTANVMGHLAVLELCRRLPGLAHLVYASTSSVYGASSELPFREDATADRPCSLYAATKRADELMSAAYAHLFGLPMSGLRFFTVYGPWGRPDMAPWLFAEAILAGRPLTLFAGGSLRRDFTFVDDIVQGVVGVLDRPAAGDAPRLLNIGNHRAESVSRFVSVMEASLGRTAIIERVAAPLTEVPATFADISAIHRLTGFQPTTPIEDGLERFCAWLRGWLAR